MTPKKAAHPFWLRSHRRMAQRTSRRLSEATRIAQTDAEAHTERIADAQRWARNGARRTPGVMFSAIVDGHIYSYETDESETLRRPE